MPTVIGSPQSRPRAPRHTSKREPASTVRPPSRLSPGLCLPDGPDRPPNSSEGQDDVQPDTPLTERATPASSPPYLLPLHLRAHLIVPPRTPPGNIAELFLRRILFNRE